MDREAAERWEIDQDDIGNPLVRHRHQSLTVQAHLTKDGDATRTARCSDCGDTLALPEHPAPGR